MKWMIYGATGYTGKLVVEEAVRRGHRPLLAGRNPEKLDVLAEDYDLDYAAFHLDDENTIAEAIADVDIVYHAAGPFIYTSEPMIRACLATNTHYIDITGEIEVFERTFSYDDAARKVGIALVSGAGFDVVPSDSIAAYVAQKIVGATHLETGIFGLDNISIGTTKTAIDSAASGVQTRRDGKLINTSFAKDSITLELPNGKTRYGASFPWGDLSVSYRTTGIPNITSYVSIPPTIAKIGRITYPITAQIMKVAAIRHFAKNIAERFIEGPDEVARHSGASYIWARATNAAGQSASAWLTTLEPYEYTAKVGVLAVERLAERDPIGALSPVQAFGMDFTLEVEGTTRQDV
ncbi:MAG: saccharopine dehydrogenase NADP-binding domain-containing protein [Phototrophicaceae bacterium]